MRETYRIVLFVDTLARKMKRIRTLRRDLHHDQAEAIYHAINECLGFTDRDCFGDLLVDPKPGQPYALIDW